MFARSILGTASAARAVRRFGWVQRDVEEQRIRLKARRGFPKYVLRLRLGWQMESLDEWNVELVLVNLPDAGNMHQLPVAIYRRP